MAEVVLSREDHDAIKGILLAERANGNANPLLPMDVDINGDGIVDSFGLDAEGNVTVVLATGLDQTLYVSEGDDIGPVAGETREVGDPEVVNEVPESRDSLTPVEAETVDMSDPDVVDEVPTAAANDEVL